MDTEGPAGAERVSFGALLKRYRLAAHLSQEALAERARLSAHAVSAYERGQRQAPYRDTVALLAKALGLSQEEAAALEVAVPRRRGPAATLPTLTLVPFPTTPRHTLPEPPTPLIGRERELAAAARLLGQTRLLSLTGAGGSGKTRLALHVAADLLGAYADGVFFVALAPIRDPGLVAATIAQALGIQEAEGHTFRDNLSSYLRERHTLLLLDNFEQVLTAAPLVADLLGQCPRLRVLVTSRAALHLRGEQEFVVPPLALPDPRAVPPVAALARYAAVALFTERSRGVRPDFALTGENALAVAEICRRLDGLPLAIELAAARGKLLPPAALLARLEHRLALLTGGARDLPARQQTLRDAIAWSYDLLNAHEQRLFRRLAVFVGGGGLAMAEAVCNADHDLGIDVLDGVAALLDQNLLFQQSLVPGDSPAPRAADESEPRVTMLETIREYALERLEGSGEAERVRGHHARVFLRLAEEAESKLQEIGAKAWLSWLEAEHDNLRAALAWSFDGGEAEIGLRLAAALGEFWLRLGHLSEGRDRIEYALAQLERLHAVQAAASESAAAAAQSPWWRDVAARLHEHLGDILAVTGLQGEARAAFRQAIGQMAAGDRLRQGRVYRKVATTWGNHLDFARAAPAYDLAEAVLGPEPAQDTHAWRQAWIDIQLDRMGMLYWLGDWPRMATLREKSVPIALASGTPRQRVRLGSDMDLGLEYLRGRYVISDEMVATARANLIAWQEEGDARMLAGAFEEVAFCLLWQGELDEADRQYRAALATVEPLGVPTEHARYLTYLAIISRKRGQVEEVRRLSKHSLALATTGGFTFYIAAAHANLAWVAWCEGRVDEARLSAGAAMAIWRGSAFPFQWTALWPLLAVALEQGERAEAIDHARALLAPPQQLLPDVLAAALEAAIAAEEGGQPEAARAALERSLELARKRHYL